jgi:hypothetical protein
MTGLVSFSHAHPPFSPSHFHAATRNPRVPGAPAARLLGGLIRIAQYLDNIFR